MDRNHEDETHERENEAKLEEANAQVRQQFAKEQTERAHWSNEKLFECAALFFADDGKSGQEGGDVQEHDGGEAGQEKIGRARVRIEEHLWAHLDGHEIAILQRTA